MTPGAVLGLDRTFRVPVRGERRPAGVVREDVQHAAHEQQLLLVRHAPHGDLAARDPGGVRLLVAVSKDLAESRYNTGKIVGTLAAMVGGCGGGRPDLAQAGGTAPEKVGEMLAAVAGVLGS